MEELMKKWLDFTVGDLETAEILSEHPKSDRSWQLVVHHCHQVVEKLLKAVIVMHGGEVAKIHDLSRLLELFDFSLPEKLVEYIDELNPHYNSSRYPDLPSMGPSFTFNKVVAEQHVKKTKELFVWLRKKHSM